MLKLHTTVKVIRRNIGLLSLVEELDNVSKARKIMGVSRDTFYRYKEAVEDGGSASNVSNLTKFGVFYDVAANQVSYYRCSTGEAAA